MMTKQRLAYRGFFWLLSVALIGLNLRPFLTASGPLAPDILGGTGMGLEAFSWLTLLPLVMFGIGTWLAPWAVRRLGARAGILYAMLLLVFGCALRLFADSASLLLATAGLCGLGVALAQGIVPGLIKRYSPHRVAQMMGAFTAAMMLGGALGAHLSPLSLGWGLNWQQALAVWALPALAAALLIWWQLGQMVAMAGSDGLGKAPGGTLWLMRRLRSWWLMLSFGIMNTGYVSMVAWMAPYYQGLGFDAAQSGGLIAILSLAQAMAALLIPLLAARLARGRSGTGSAHQPDRRWWIWFGLLCQTLGFAALAWWPLASPLALAIVLGIGLGTCFPFFMILALDHLPDPLEAGALNAFMQAGGFILSALAPWAMAQLQQMSGSFVSGWLMQMGLGILVAFMLVPLRPAGYESALNPPNGHDKVAIPDDERPCPFPSPQPSPRGRGGE